MNLQKSMIRFGELYNFVNGKIITSVNYARYWHGNLIIFRPLLLFFNVLEIRYLMLLIFVILLICFSILLRKKFGRRIALIFDVALICNGYFSASYSLESAPIFLVMMISSIFLLKNIEKIKDESMYFFVVGCVANFVDFLTVPLITLCIPLFIYILHMQNEEKNVKECLFFVIKNSVIWVSGYALTWMSKWFLFDLLFNGEMVKIGFEQILHRTQRVNEYSSRTVFETIAIVLRINILYLYVSMLAGMIFRVKFNGKKHLKESLCFLLPAVMPLAWYLVLGNHTIIHLFFTYRHMSVFLCGMYLCLNRIFSFEKFFCKKNKFWSG